MDKFMNIFEGNGVPLDAITKGRSLGDVLSKYMEMWEGAKKALGFHGEDPEAEFATLMQATVYRLYLLGVEDGMREGQA